MSVMHGRETDERLALHLGWERMPDSNFWRIGDMSWTHGGDVPPWFTSSADACLRALRDTLPEWYVFAAGQGRIEDRNGHLESTWWTVVLRRAGLPVGSTEPIQGFGETLALALSDALLQVPGGDK